jgi:hypothetical protein
MSPGYIYPVRAKFYKESFRIAINDNPIHSVGLVFNMTDCLSEDDEKHHPVLLLQATAYPCTPAAWQKMYDSPPGHAYFRTGTYLLPGTFHSNRTVLHPVFPHHHPYGMTGS